MSPEQQTSDVSHASGAADLTVIVASDFEAGSDKTWADEISMAQALARQDIETPFHVVFAESEAHRSSPVPAEIHAALPSASILYAPAEDSAQLKDAAVRECRTPWVAILEADARPEKDWLRQLLGSADEVEEGDVFSGRTHYGDKSSWQRVLNLLDRSFDDLGASRDTTHVSNNGALYRTNVAKQFPYPDAGSPFLSSRQRMEQMHSSGCNLYFNRNALMQHAIGGISFVWDFRRNTGYADVLHRPRTSLLQAVLAGRKRMSHDLKTAVRLGRKYLKPHDWPLWTVMFLFVRVPEAAGAFAALSGSKRLANSAYR